MRLSGSLASASHSACGPFIRSFVGKFEHILAPCVHSLFSLSVAQWQPRTKKTLLSCSLFKFSSFSFLLFLLHFCFSQTGIGQGTSNLFLRQAEPQWDLAGLKGFLPSLWLFSVSPSFWASEKGCKLVSWGVLLCWLQETDALQEFWKQIRLTLFSGPWLLFPPMC